MNIFSFNKHVWKDKFHLCFHIPSPWNPMKQNEGFLLWFHLIKWISVLQQICWFGFFPSVFVRPKLNPCVLSFWSPALYPGFSLSVSNDNVFHLGTFGNSTTVICNVICQWSETVPVELHPLGHASEPYIPMRLVSSWTLCLSWLIRTNFWRT